MPLTQFDERTIFVSPNSYANPTAIGIQTLANGTGYGTRIDQLLLSWNGAAPIEVDLRLNDGFGDVAFIGTVVLAAITGTVLTSVDVLAALFPANQQYINLNASGALELLIKSAISGTDVLGAYASGGNF